VATELSDIETHTLPAPPSYVGGLVASLVVNLPTYCYIVIISYHLRDVFHHSLPMSPYL